MVTLAAEHVRGQANKLVPRNNVIRLHGLSWSEYLDLREDSANDHLRMHYSNEDLLLMTTGDLHERLARLIDLYLTVWARANGIRLMSYGRWTMFAKSDQKGLEPDNCYYIRDIPDVTGQRELNLESDPPPQLAVEVDITTDSGFKFEIYRALGIQEVWIWRAGRLVAYAFQNDAFVAVESSRLIPGFPLTRAAELITAHYNSDDGTALDAFLSDVSA